MGAYSDLNLDRQFEDDPFAEEADIPAFEEMNELDFPPLDTESSSAITAENSHPAEDVLPAVVPKKTDSPPPQPSVEIPDASENETAADDGEDARRKAHEESEAKRKAEWEARQQQKKAALQEQLDRLSAMSDDEAASAAMKRVGADTEKLTRRNMKECVSEYIQTQCLEDAAFARKVMHPGKSMIHCFQYISRKAWEYVQDELKASGITPGSGRDGYGCDIPDDLCYQWSVDYFNDPDAKEDQVEEETFTPKPYYGKSSRFKKKVSKKTDVKKPEPKKPAPKPADESGQLTLGAFAMPEEKAG